MATAAAASSRLDPSRTGPAGGKAMVSPSALVGRPAEMEGAFFWPAIARSA
jgi:hypothetical protein